MLHFVSVPCDALFLLLSHILRADCFISSDPHALCKLTPSDDERNCNSLSVMKRDYKHTFQFIHAVRPAPPFLLSASYTFLLSVLGFVKINAMMQAPWNAKRQMVIFKKERLQILSWIADTAQAATDSFTTLTEGEPRCPCLFIIC